MPSFTVYRLIAAFLIVFISSIASFAQTPRTITLRGISSTTLCSGAPVTVAFDTTGLFPANTQFELYITDFNGNFIGATKLGSGLGSPITVSLPSGNAALPVTPSYQIKVIAAGLGVESLPSGRLNVGNVPLVLIYNRANVPADITVCTNSITTLIADSVPSASYTWYRNNSPISGVNSRRLQTNQDGTYSLLVNLGACQARAASSLAITHSTRIVPGFISYYGIPPLQCEGTVTKLTADYAGESATFEWFKDGTAISGSNSYTYNAIETGSYSYRVTDQACQAAVQGAIPILLGKSLNVTIQNNYNLDRLAICPGSSGITSLYLNYVGFPPPSFQFQWFRDGVPISQATDRIYNAQQPGAYSLRVRQASCETFSNSIVLEENPTIQVSITNLYGNAFCTGESRQLFANAPYADQYQWQKEGVDIPGATGIGYTITQTGNYTMKVKRGNCTAISRPESVSFSNVSKPIITFNEGSLRFMGYQYTNLFGYQYQWQKDGVDIPDEKYGYALSIYRGPGVYTLIETNGTCKGTSNKVFIGLGETPRPVMSADLPTNLKRCLGNSVHLTTSSGFPLKYQYQWLRNGIAIPKATNSDYYAVESGSFNVRMTDEAGTVIETAPLPLTIGEPTTATLLGNFLIGNGQIAAPRVSFTGPPPWSFTLTNGQIVKNTVQNPYLLAVSPNATTAYALASVANSCGTGSVAGNSVVTIGNGSADISLNMAFTTRTPDRDKVVDVFLTLTNAGPQEAVGIQATSQLPTGLAFVNAVSSGISYANGRVSADVGTMAINEVKTIHFQVKATQAGVFVMTAQVATSQTPDPDSQPNSGTGDGQDDMASVDLRTSGSYGPIVVPDNSTQTPLPSVLAYQPPANVAKADLNLTMSINTTLPKVGEVVTINVQLSNQGGADASAIITRIMLPTGWQLTNADGFVVNGLVVQGYINQLPANQSATLKLLVRVGNSSEPIRAQILEMAESDPDSIPGNGYQTGEDDEASIYIRMR